MSQLNADGLKKRRLEAIRQVFGRLSTASTAMSRCGVGKLAQMARYRARIKGYMETMTRHGWDRKRPEIIPKTLRWSRTCNYSWIWRGGGPPTWRGTLYMCGSCEKCKALVNPRLGKYSLDSHNSIWKWRIWTFACPTVVPWHRFPWLGASCTWDILLRTLPDCPRILPVSGGPSRTGRAHIEVSPLVPRSVASSTHWFRDWAKMGWLKDLRR
jgi:hypothetical protein